MLDHICSEDLDGQMKALRTKYYKYDSKISESKDIMNEMIIQMKLTTQLSGAML